MISILHPSRSRPERSRRTLQRWIDRAAHKPEIIISLDSNDSCLGSYEINELNGHYESKRIIINENRSAVDAINRAAEAATGDIFVVVSDDTDCPDLWDTKIFQATQGRKDWILKTQDGLQGWIITMPVMDRAYYNRFGYVYFPEYLHMFCDTELTAVADLTDRKIEADILFPHNHYSLGKSEKDMINTKADATWGQGEKLFIDRVKKNFGLDNPPGKIKSASYLNWIAKKLHA